MDPVKEPECQSLPAEFKALDDYFDIFLTLRHLGLPFEAKLVVPRLWKQMLGAARCEARAWVATELGNIAATQLLCHSHGKQDDAAVSESIKDLRSSLGRIDGSGEAKIKWPVARQYLAQRAAELQADLDALTAYSSLAPLSAYSVSDSGPAHAASDPATDGCAVCQGRKTPLVPSWEYLRRSAATVVVAMDLTEMQFQLPSTWSEYMMKALYLRCHPLAGLEKRLKDCPVFTEGLLRSLRGFAIFSICKHVASLLSMHGKKQKIDDFTYVRAWTDTHMWLHNLESGHSEDALVMKQHGIEVSTLKAALFDPYKTDGVEEEALGRGVSPFVRAILAAMEAEMIDMEARMTQIADQNKEMVRLLREMTVSNRGVGRSTDALETERASNNPFIEDPFDDNA